MTERTVAYDVRHLTKTFPGAREPANDDISLTIERGACFGIFGPNGAGKTTLVRQMAALLAPTSGAIHLFGEDVVAHPDVVPRAVGYFGQRSAALDDHTFHEVCFITGILRGLPSEVAKRRSRKLIERFDAQSLAGRRLGTLSGGEQRLALLCAVWVGEPAVLILDEPTNELDPLRRRAVWSYLQELRQRRSTTVVLVTHNLLEAERVVERVAIVDRGRVQALGTPGELKRRVLGAVRLEVQLREDIPEEAGRRLGEVVGATLVAPGRWQIAAPQDEATRLLERIVGLVGMDALDDFRLVTPSMEDVYVQLTGRQWDGAGRAAG